MSGQSSNGLRVGVWVGAASLLLICALLFLFDPQRHGFYPRCVLKSLTNLDCPGCGGLRATHQLLHGNIKEAFAFNPLAVTALPVLLFIGINALVARYRGQPLVKYTISPVVIVIIGIVVVLFTILRNVRLFG